MKKLFNFILLGLFFCFGIIAKAEVIPHTIYAVPNEIINVSELRANDTIHVKTIEEYKISDTEYVQKNSIIKLKVLEYVNPKRGKRDGYLKVQILSYTIPTMNNFAQNVSDREVSGKLKLKNPKDKKEMAKSAGVSVLGAVLEVPLLTQAVAFTKGLIKPNEDQSRLKSAGTNVYKSTPLVYGEKGKELIINKDSILVLKVKNRDDEDNEDDDEIEE